MDNDSKKITKEITYIALGVAAIIAGGFIIFYLSLIFPLPGIKYIFMAPYLSMMIFILLKKTKRKNALLKIGSTFGFIMFIINPFMGATIIVTTILSHLSIKLFSDSKKELYGAILFSGYTGLVALTVSKYVIGGVFRDISSLWLILTGLICLVFGTIGTLLGKKILKHLG